MRRLNFRSFILKIFIVCIVVNHASAAAESATAMADLTKSLTNLPSNWNPGTDFCKWTGVVCNAGEVTSISLAEKSISGTLPPSFNQLTSLRTLNLQRNAISGHLPSFSGMTSLQILNLDSNGFDFMPPNFFSGLTSLVRVSLDDNPLAAWEIPDDLGNADSLNDFSASNAGISGTIPEFFGRFSSLESLRLSYNNLTGGLPSSFPGSSIKSLFLNNQKSADKLTGRIDVVGSMDQLSLVWLQSNSFSGPIPEVGNLTSLTSFDVRDNQLTGIVPSTLLKANLDNVTLSNNNLQGPLPVFGASVTADINKGNNFCLDTPGPCDPRVMTLLAVAAGFGYPLTLATSWEGNDPCSDWEGVICDSKGNEILILNFANQHFVGTIAPEIADLKSLTKVLLNDNNLTGPIPNALTSLKSLQILDVSNNDLWGKVPPFDKSVDVRVSGNPRIGTVPSPNGPPSADGSPPIVDGHSKKTFGVVVGVIVGAIVLVAAAVFVYYYYFMEKKNEKENEQVVNRRLPNEGSEDQLRIGIMQYNARQGGNENVPKQGTSENVSRQGTSANASGQGSSGNESRHESKENNVLSTIPIEVLQRATNNFDPANILGEGGFAVVYKGNLDGTLVAVKRCNPGMSLLGKKRTEEEDFETEVKFLQSTRHRNLVSFLGCCRDENEMILVYEYVAEGTLEEHLHEHRSGKYCPLNCKQRLMIALDVARGVEYLHSLAVENFIHRDLKPSNILLDKDLRAKVADFGLVKLVNKENSFSTGVAGTQGYLAPEYAMRGKLSTKVDVYSYGIILIELVSGRKVVDNSKDDEDDEAELVYAFQKYIHDPDRIMRFVDATLQLDDEGRQSIMEVSKLAVLCTSHDRKARPTMSYAVQVLSPLVDKWVPDDPIGGFDVDEELRASFQRLIEGADHSSRTRSNSDGGTYGEGPSEPYR